MRKIALFISLIGTIGCISAQKLHSSADVDTYILNEIKQKKIAGAVILVSQYNKTTMHKAYGYQDLTDKIIMDTLSIFRIHSMTKPLTSLAIMMLVDRGAISLEDSIVTYLPELKNIKVLDAKNESKLKKEITIRDLLRHTSGFGYGFGLGSSKVYQLYDKNHPLFVATGNEMIN